MPSMEPLAELFDDRPQIVRVLLDDSARLLQAGRFVPQGFLRKWLVVGLDHFVSSATYFVNHL